MSQLSDQIQSIVGAPTPSTMDSSSSPLASQISQIDQSFSPVDASTPQDLVNANTTDAQSGWCQKFVDDAIGTPDQNRQPSADDAWNNYQSTGQATQGLQGIQPGDIVYFDNNHVGIFAGKDKFISATEEDPTKPVQTHTFQAWNDITGDIPLGYVKNPQSLPPIGGSNVSQ
jgi:hypothetical protein